MRERNQPVEREVRIDNLPAVKGRCRYCRRKMGRGIVLHEKFCRDKYLAGEV